MNNSRVILIKKSHRRNRKAKYKFFLFFFVEKEKKTWTPQIKISNNFYIKTNFLFIAKNC